MPGIVLINPVNREPEYVPEDQISDYVRRGYTTPAGGATTETSSGRQVVVGTPELQSALATGGSGVNPSALAAQQAQEAERAQYNTLGQEALTFGEGALEGLTAGASNLLLDSEESRMRAEVNPLAHGAGVIGGAVAPALAGEEGSLAGLLRNTPAGLSMRAGEAAAGLVKLPAATRLGQALVQGVTGAVQGTVDAGLYGAGSQAVDSLLHNRPFAAEAVLSDAALGASLGVVLGFAAGGLKGLGKAADIAPAVEANTADALSEMGSRLRQADDFVKQARLDVAALANEPGGGYLAEQLAAVNEAEKQLKAVAGLKNFDGAEAKLARRLKGLDGEEAQLFGRAMEDYEVASARLDDALNPFRDRLVRPLPDEQIVNAAGVPEAKRGVKLQTPLGEIDPYNFNPEKYMEHWGTPEYRELLRRRFNFMADDYVNNGRAFQKFGAEGPPQVIAAEAGVKAGDKTGAFSPEALRAQGAPLPPSSGPKLIDTPLGKIDPDGPPLHDLFPDKVGTPEYAEAVNAKAEYFRGQLTPGRHVPSEELVGPAAPVSPAQEKLEKLTNPGKVSAKEPVPAPPAEPAQPIQVTKDTAPPAAKPPRQAVIPYSARAPKLNRAQIGARALAGGSPLPGGGIQAMDVQQVAHLMGADVAKVPGAGPVSDAAMKVWALNRLAKATAQAEKGTGGIFGHIMRAAEVGGAGGTGRRIGQAVVGHAVGGPIGAAVGYAIGRDVWRGAGRLASTAGRALRQVENATAKLLGHTAPSIAKGVVAAKAINDIHLGPPSKDDPKDNLARMRAELGRVMANPDALDQAVDDHFAGVRTLAPDVADKIKEAYKLRLQNYANMIPKPPPGLYRPEEWKGDPIATSTFYRYLMAAEDPYGRVVNRLNKATPIELKALQDNWPETLNEIRRNLIARGDEVAKLGHIQAAKVSEILGQPVVGFADPGLWRRQQALYEQDRGQKPQASGSASKINIDSGALATPGQSYAKTPTQTTNQ